MQNETPETPLSVKILAFFIVIGVNGYAIAQYLTA